MRSRVFSIIGHVTIRLLPRRERSRLDVEAPRHFQDSSDRLIESQVALPHHGTGCAYTLSVVDALA